MFEHRHARRALPAFRLDGPEQVDEGLGIRVVGTLPSLSSRKALDPSHPVVAQLTESIDGVRTILMHDSTSKRRQVVLLTSAATMEGRTTVASQLAASLARAGRPGMRPRMSRRCCQPGAEPRPSRGKTPVPVG